MFFPNYMLVSGKWNLSKWIKYIFIFYGVPFSLWTAFFGSISKDYFFVALSPLLAGSFLLIGTVSRIYIFYYGLIAAITYPLFLFINGRSEFLQNVTPPLVTSLMLILYFYYLFLMSKDIEAKNYKIRRLLIGSRRDKRKINEEMAKSDKLLLNVLPKEVAEELKANGSAEPKSYNSVSVMFTDFVGFTEIAESMEASSLVKELDFCFSYFDSVTKKHNLEKIKTIGDSYMICSGIPKVNNTHPIDTVLAALEIQSFMKDLKLSKEKQNLPYWDLRLGINTGPLVAAVIGEMKFVYDVFGDTVNIASRMESSGESGKINISSATYEMIKDFFECESRGKIAAKSKGMIEMYFVTGIKSQYSLHGEGKLPNDEFYKTYSKLKQV